MKEQGVFIAHCPQSNMNVSSGIAPVKQYLREGQKVGLGSDVAGGAHLSIFRAMTDAIQCSKLRWRLVDQDTPALTLPEALYMATKGGGAFFGKVGSFEPGYQFDAVVLDDSTPAHHPQLYPGRAAGTAGLSLGRPPLRQVRGGPQTVLNCKNAPDPLDPGHCCVKRISRPAPDRKKPGGTLRRPASV